MSVSLSETTLGIPVDRAIGTWELDPAHSTVSFITRYLGFSKVRGSFTRVSATAVVADDLPRSHGRATIETASIDTGNEQRDGHLRGTDFFDVERFPTIEFEARDGEPRGDGSFSLRGDLTLHGVTRPVELEGQFLGMATDPYGREKAAFTASTRINREDFGLTWNQALETGGFLVSKEVDIEVEAQMVRTAG